MEPVSLDALRKVDIHACSVCMTMHSSQQFVINDYMVLDRKSKKREFSESGRTHAYNKREHNELLEHNHTLITITIIN